VKAVCPSIDQPVRSIRRVSRPTPGISRPQSGQALVEMAFVLPILLVLALGVIEMGRYAYLGILVGNAARAGSAFGAQSTAQAGQATNIQTAARNDFQNNGQVATSLSVTSTFTCGCDSAGTIAPPPQGTNATCFVAYAYKCTAGGHWVVMVAVTASEQFNSLFNYPGIPTSITVTRLSQMRVAQN
jgi:Flp pilus assembly protein TadG